MKKTQEELREEKQGINGKELTDEILGKTVGGEGESEPVVLTVDLPDCFSESYILEVFADGILKSNMTQTIDPSREQISLRFNGTRGSSLIQINLNHMLYKTYQIDFGSASFKEI